MSALREKGFAPLWMPSPAVKPLQLYLRNGDDMRLYYTLSPTDSDRPFPQLEASFSAGLLSGVTEETDDLDFGLSLVSNTLSFLSGGTVNLGVSSRSARRVSYRYTNLDRVVGEFLPVRRFIESLSAAEFKEIARHETYVILETLRARGIQVAVLDSQGRKLKAEETTVMGISVNSFRSENNTMLFQGEIPVTIGYRAVFIAESDGKLEMSDVTPAADLPAL